MDQGRVEDRLVILEGAVAGLAAASAARHNKSTKQMATLLQQMSTMTKQQESILKQQKALETKLDMILNKKHVAENKNEQTDVSASKVLRQEYVNWTKEHHSLLEAAFVPYQDFLATLELLTKYESAPGKIIKMLETPFKVNKSTRFPCNGFYVNAYKSSIKHEIDELVFVLKKGWTLRMATDQQRCMNKIIVKLKTMENGHGMYDVTSFEDIYGLNWADVIEHK